MSGSACIPPMGGQANGGLNNLGTQGNLIGCCCLFSDITNDFIQPRDRN